MCLYVNDYFDDWKNQRCVYVLESSWMVWIFFRKDADFLAKKIPVFANVYKVKVKQQANQSILKCDCLHCERCGIPCTDIMKITNQIDETMITGQSLKGVSSCSYQIA
jgi:hypothetical protein